MLFSPRGGQGPKPPCPSGTASIITRGCKTVKENGSPCSQRGAREAKSPLHQPCRLENRRLGCGKTARPTDAGHARQKPACANIDQQFKRFLGVRRLLFRWCTG